MSWREILATLALVGATGCHTMKFDVGTGRVSNVVYERKSYYLWGLTPTVKVDVSKHCPNGAVAIKEQTTFVDGLFELFTLSIWTPRSSWYYCAAEQI